MAVVYVDRSCYFVVFIKLSLLLVLSSRQVTLRSVQYPTVSFISSSYVNLTALNDSFASPTVSPCSSVYDASPVLLWVRQSGIPFRPRPGRCLQSSFIAFLLLTIERNPGPATALRVASFNAGGANKKGAAIDDLIADNSIDVLAVCESWIRDDAPEAVKVDMAPSNYAVLHAHRSRVKGAKRSRRGGGLAIIHKTSLPVRTLRSGYMPNQNVFELQLVGLQVGKTLVKVANIYRPPSSSKADFINEFAELLTSVGLGQNERLVICGDFNMPGADENSIDDQLSSLLNTHGYNQHVTSPTRHDASRRCSNLLDLVITVKSTQLPLVSNVQVVSSHGLSDHDVVIFELSVRRFKAPAVRYSYRNIKQVVAADFNNRLLASKIVADPPDTPDEFVAQLESIVTGILDDRSDQVRQQTERPEEREVAVL